VSITSTKTVTVTLVWEFELFVQNYDASSGNIG
jgi:hypothetical protein